MNILRAWRISLGSCSHARKAVEPLEKERQDLPKMAAIYFISADQAAINQLVRQRLDRFCRSSRSFSDQRFRQRRETAVRQRSFVLHHT
jgi:hypothetical protein